MREVESFKTDGSSALSTSASILAGRQAVGNSISFEEPESTDRAESEATLLHLHPPQPKIPTDAISEAVSFLPPTTLDRELIKDLLINHTEAASDERIAQLLAIAWESSGVIERAVPSALLARIHKDPAAWYLSHAASIERIIEERTGLIDIYDETDPYEQVSPFLRNAVAIHDIADNRGKRHEGLRVELGARLIIQEAINAPQAD